MCADAFAADALRRFANPLLGHACVQVGADGSRKLPQRLLPIVEIARRQGLPLGRVALVVAAWICAAAGRPVKGEIVPAVDDPHADAMRAAGDAENVVRIALGADVDRSFAAAVIDAIRALEREGVAAMDGAS
jgi:fructuronate reductase